MPKVDMEEVAQMNSSVEIGTPAYGTQGCCYSRWRLKKSQSHSTNFALLIFFLFTFFHITVTSSLQLPESGVSILHTLESVRHHRSLRSPYLPPTVIGMRPSLRSNDSDSPNTIVKSSIDTLNSPFIHSQSTSRTSVNHHGDAENENSNSFDYERAMVSYALPRPPMVIDSSALHPHGRTPIDSDGEELSILLQNDQSVGGEDGISGQGETEEFKRLEKESQKSKSKNSKRLMKFVDFSQVLNTINMTNPQLETLLRRKNIAFNDFLEFIENGASEEQILKLLESPKHQPASIPEGKPDWKSKGSFKKFQPSDDMNSKIFSKGLTELPFTEIVHQVPFESGKQLDTNQLLITKDQGNDSKLKKKFNSRKWSRSPKQKEDSDKENYIKQPFDYEPEFDNYLLPKDSPIVTHFHPSRTKNQSQISAAILSVSIEEQNKAKPIKASEHHFHARNKMVSTETVKVESSSLPRISSELTKDKGMNPSKGGYEDSQYVRQQLRLVFPMRGLIIFCGILGILSFFTILILVIYGALKCNKKPVAAIYKVKESNDIAVSVA